MADAMRVLIVGAGLAGVSLAISLRERGVSPDVIERLTAWPSHGAGIYLVGNAMRALQALGVAEDVHRQGAGIRRQVLMDRRGRKLVEIDTESVWGSCGPCVGVRRAVLQQELVNALGESEVQFSTTVTSIEQQGDGVAVGFSDGTERNYELVVGADGVHSSIRQRLFPKSLARYCGQVGWRFIVSCPPAIDSWTLFSGPKGVFLFIPVGGGQAYCYADAMLTEPIADPLEGRLERLRTRFSGFTTVVSEALAELKSSEQIHFGIIEDIFQHSWAAGNVLLFGDAAHATSPNMASGAAMAFEDSIALSEALTSGHDIQKVIDEYSSRRQKRIRWVHEQTKRRDRIRNLPPLVRNLLTRHLFERIYRSNYGPLAEEF